MIFSDYCSELMKQSFSDSTGKNYTPLAIMFYLKENNYYFDERPIEDLVKYVYRFYTDNQNYAKSNSNVIISNIYHYNASDIKQYVFEQIKIWIQNGSGIISFDGLKIKINQEMSDLSENNIIMLNKIVDSLIVRNFGCNIHYDSNIDAEMETVDWFSQNYLEYISRLNKTRFINRAYEDLDYCVCCEETERSLLQPVHINRKLSQCDSNNSLVLCKEHAHLYFDGYFRFNKAGKILIYKQHPLLDKRMHLSHRILKLKSPYLED